jgi:hypothetical protein
MHKNLSGGCFSILGYSALLLFGLYKFISMVNKDDPTNTSSFSP